MEKQYESFVRLTAKVRELQREYYSTRSFDILKECKALERRLDEEIKKYFNPQKTLF